MAYDKVHETWENLPSTDTPANAAALEQIEQGIADAADTADAAASAASSAASGLADHLADTSNAHAATAISVTPIAGTTGSNAQSVLESIQSNITAAGGTVDTVQDGTGLDVDASDPANPVVSIDSTVYHQGGTDVAVADGGTGASTASAARTNLGLGTMATQDASAVAVTGGTIAGITDLAVADGGTGASTAANARTNLGLGTAAVRDLIDDDTMATAAATNIPSAESVVAYVSTVALLPYSGAKVSRATGQSGVLNNTFTFITWTVEDWDESGWWAGGSPTRLTVPSGVGKVEIKTNISFAGSNNGKRLIFIQKNAATTRARVDHHPVQGGDPTVLFLSFEDTVVAGDYFEIAVLQSSGGTMTVGADFCWASIKRIDD